ncbi:lipoyl synthase [Buchnera aphidicola]
MTKHFTQNNKRDNNIIKNKKPDWIKIKLLIDNNKINAMKSTLRTHNLFSVCEEAQCPNLQDCFNRGTATFMILGAICTRKCPFCAVSKGRPTLPNAHEPNQLKVVINKLNIKHVVLTSVTRDDLKDGGAQHFFECIKAIKSLKKNIKIEILVPDFKNCSNNAVSILSNAYPDIFNHNLESVPRIYKAIRPGANYQHSLNLLLNFKNMNPNVITKSGIMIGLGEKKSEIINVISDLKTHRVDMITIGQYLQPTSSHFPVKHYYTISEFNDIKNQALSIGFRNVFCGPFVRSSYNADEQFLNNTFSNKNNFSNN